MLKRLVVGLILGLVIGGVVAVAMVQGLHAEFAAGAGGGVLAYLAAAVTGGVTGLVAGKPIWSGDGKIEGSLKAVFGAVLALGGMWALRRWGTAEVDLSALKAGAGAIGELPYTSLPIIASVLGAFYELDNTPKDDEHDKDEKKSASSGDKKANGKVRVAKEEEAEEEEEADEPVAKAKKK